MIGSGIFIVSADIGRQVGQWGPGALLLVWIVTGAMTVTGALAYAELAAMMPKAGGQYVFLREGLSPLAGFLYGWTLFAVIQTGTIAAVAVAFAKFLGVLVPGVSPDVFLPLGQLRLPGASEAIQLGLSPQRVVAIVMIAVLTAINMRGVTLGAAIQTVFSVAKVGALAALVLLGLTLFRQPDIAAANFADFWGTGDWSLAVHPGARRGHGGLALLERRLEQRHLRRRRGAEPHPEPAARARDRHRDGESALHPRQRRLPQHPAVLRRSRTAPTCSPAGIQYAAQDRVGTAAIEVVLGAGGGHASWRWRSCSRPSAATTGSFSPARGSTTRWRATTSSSSGRARCTRPTARRSSGWWRRPSGPACSASAAPTGSCSTT